MGLVSGPVLGLWKIASCWSSVTTPDPLTLSVNEIGPAALPTRPSTTPLAVTNSRIDWPLAVSTRPLSTPAALMVSA